LAQGFRNHFGSRQRCARLIRKFQCIELIQSLNKNTMPKKKPFVIEEDAKEEVKAEQTAAPEEASKPKDSEDPAPAKAEAQPASDFKPHDSYPPITKAEVVEYCPVCGLPPDFCQFGTCWDKCKPVCMEKFPQYYPELAGASLADAKKTAEEAAEQAKIKELPGGKKET